MPLALQVEHSIKLCHFIDIVMNNFKYICTINYHTLLIMNNGYISAFKNKIKAHRVIKTCRIESTLAAVQFRINTLLII